MKDLMATVEATGLLEPLMERYGELSDVPRDAGIEAGDLLPYFLHLNSTAYQEADLGGQWAIFLEVGVDPLLGRARVARREVRDLRIATHIRWVTARHPGSRVLVLIGASHKPFLESFLSQMYDIELVQLSEFVRATEPGS